jgi:ABC-type Fe3+-hydroxamate transport system substrate-binding protein
MGVPLPSMAQTEQEPGMDVPPVFPDPGPLASLRASLAALLATPECRCYGGLEAMPITIRDALDRELTLSMPAERIVSLVPSETESVAELAGIERLVGRTDFCEEPAGEIDRVPSVGGTKKFDADAVAELQPDLVLANKEENGRKLVEQLIEAGLPVHVSFPHTVPEALGYLQSLAAMLGVSPQAEPIVRAESAFEQRRNAVHHDEPLRVFVPIWRDPWMTFDGRAFASDMLELCGMVNVFLDRPRRYPLAADLGKREAWSEDRVGERDTRYPRIRLEEVAQREPDAILLPDEPYAFSDKDAAELAELDVPAARTGRIRLVSGKDLFWYGTRVGPALERLGEVVGR